MYQLIIFDWDGTLMDSAQKISNCIRASASDVGLEVPSHEQAKSIIGLGLFEAMAFLYPDAEQSQLTKMVDAYKHHFVSADKTEQQLFPGVVEGLKELEQAGALLAVATGKSRAGLNRVFDALDLRNYFVTSRCADETRSKPHPQMLHEILDYTAIEPHKAIMVGDTTFDMDMAANASMAALGAGYGVHSNQLLYDSKALTVRSSFTELIAWLLDGRVERAYELSDQA